MSNNSLKEFLKQKMLFIKHICLPSPELEKRIKRKFHYFGDGSEIIKPYLQLSGIDRISIEGGTTILTNCRLSVYKTNTINEVFPNICIGNRCYIGFGFSALASSDAKIIIGDDVLIASNVTITNENHGMNPESDTAYMNQDLESDDVTIGDGCWIGEKVTVLPGSHIGKKCIIGANAVVLGNIPDYSIAVGIPARVVKKYNFELHNWEKA